MTVAATRTALDWIVAVLRGEDPGPPADATSVLAACESEEVTPIVGALARTLPTYAGWPADLQTSFDRAERDAAARELVIRAELGRVLGALADADVHPLLLKGTPLAYLIYDAPSHRGRDDTDLLVPKSAVERTKAALRQRGYEAPPYSAGSELLGQVPLVRRDAMGLEHWIDVHWALSAARSFADTLTYDELAAAAIPVPPLGPPARTLGMPHALLLACMHPAMHHRNAQRLAWDQDVHRLATRFSAADWSLFVEMAHAKRLRAVARHALCNARAQFGTEIPADVESALARQSGPEPTAAYLAAGRGWLDELSDDLTARASWASRVTLLREIAFPRASYLLAAYGVRAGPAGWLLLPFLYAHRAARGLWRLARGRK